MNMIPMGEYYVWHCDWCDSTNHTLWSHLDEDGPACAACHHHAVATTPSLLAAAWEGGVVQNCLNLSRAVTSL